MDSVPRSLDPLGLEIRRWLSEADGRLFELSAATSDLPRADDFGHVTVKPPTGTPSDATIAHGARATRFAPTVSTPIASERHGIFVASGWGARVRWI